MNEKAVSVAKGGEELRPILCCRAARDIDPVLMALLRMRLDLVCLGASGRIRRLFYRHRLLT